MFRSSANKLKLQTFRKITLKKQQKIIKKNEQKINLKKKRKNEFLLTKACFINNKHLSFIKYQGHVQNGHL